TLNEDGTYNLSDAQARAILDLRLQRLTAMGVKEIGDELAELAEKITDYLDILRSRERIMQIIRDELTAVKEGFATPRRTEIVEWEGDLDDEDLIEREDMVVTITHGGYIKRTPLSEFRAQARGGKGLAGMAMKDDDFVSRLFVANTPLGPQLKVLDFGIVKVLQGEGQGSVLTQTGELLGSPAYMSPEQLVDSGQIDHRSDIWALGAVLHELISGATPFEGASLIDL
ncbi:MAG: DNA gyrase C-terminal beta-propeller domain-containing protein, partial [Pseudomonadota bacterium]